MAQLNAFNAALLRCGFNADSADAITGEGFDTLEVLADVEEEDIDSMIKASGRRGRPKAHKLRET
jgi:hypothetical protein